MASVKETRFAIKALPGMTALHADGEWRVTINLYRLSERYPDKKTAWCEEKQEAMAYYTEDAEDALATARKMSEAWMAEARSDLSVESDVVSLTKRQQEALDAFRESKGRNWKAALRMNWERASYPGISMDDAAALQQLRNTLGPEWLNKYSAPVHRPHEHVQPQGEDVRLVAAANTSIKTHDLRGLDAEDAYAESQTNSDIGDGHVLLLSGDSVAIMVQAWPTLVKGDVSGFHRLREGDNFESFEGGKYAQAARVALSHEAKKISGKGQYLFITLDDTETAAFADLGHSFEIKRILVETAHRIGVDGIGDGFLLNDLNGNAVGRVELHADSIIEPFELPPGAVRIGLELQAPALAEGSDLALEVSSVILHASSKIGELGTGTHVLLRNERGIVGALGVNPLPDRSLSPEDGLGLS